MKTNYLFPHSCKKLGWFVLIPFLVLAIAYFALKLEPEWLNVKVFAIFDDEFFGKFKFFHFVQNNIIDEIISIGILVGGFLVAFSKEKIEDEFISKIRYESLLWATYLNYTILAFSIIFMYGGIFFWVMTFNLFTILTFFIIRFNWIIYSYKKQIEDEK
jgi:hypothetical protein